MDIQELLTIAAESILFGSIALYSHLFVTGYMARSRRVSPGQLEINFAVVEQSEQPEQNQKTPETRDLTIASVPPAPEQPRFEVVILPFERPSRKPEQPQTIDLSSYSIRQLKAIASAVKLPKYNVEPKANLQARLLAEVERDRLLEVLGTIAA